MSAATKKKHVYDETLNSYSLPTEEQSIVRVSDDFLGSLEVKNTDFVTVPDTVTVPSECVLETVPYFNRESSKRNGFGALTIAFRIQYGAVTIRLRYV